MARKSNWTVKDSFTDNRGRVWTREHNSENAHIRIRYKDNQGYKTARTWTTGGNQSKNNAIHYMDSMKQLWH